MGSRRIGLARTETLIENLKRALTLGTTTISAASVTATTGDVVQLTWCLSTMRLLVLLEHIWCSVLKLGPNLQKLLLLTYPAAGLVRQSNLTLLLSKSHIHRR